MPHTPHEKLIYKIEQLLKKAIDRYALIAEGDSLLIGLSGGKDSLALVELLGRRMRIFKPRFTVRAVHVGMLNIPYATDELYLRRHCEQFGIPFEGIETSFDLSTDTRKSPCFLCSWTRRKQLFAYARLHGCNKLVLGHHQDDMIETLLMNMTFQGAIGTMPPKLAMRKFELTIIRPMALIPESMLQQMAALREYPKQIKNCPYEQHSYRSKIKEIVDQLEALNPEARASIWSSMSRIQRDYLPTEVSDPESSSEPN